MATGTSFFTDGTHLLKITNKRTDAVQVAVDPLFDLLLPRLVPLFKDQLCLRCIEEIDHAKPIAIDKDSLPVLQTPFGIITPSQLSSGVKSFLLIMYRKLHPELNWIPSIDSMGTNAKQFLFDHVDDLDFPVYCSICGMRFYDVPCLDDKNNITTIGDYLSDEENI